MVVTCYETDNVQSSYFESRQIFEKLVVWLCCDERFTCNDKDVDQTSDFTSITVCVCLYSYRNLATEHETLMQKYLHLLQIVETEKMVAKQLRQQIEDGEIEIERLKSEVNCLVISC